MRRTIILIYGVASYALFFGTFLYTVGFLANAVVPRSIDTGAGAPLLSALLINCGLLALFAIQHSVMARRGFKRILVRFIPAEAERSTYVLLSSVVMILVFWLWQPISHPIWVVESEIGRIVLWGLCFAGVGLVLYTTFLIDHFDLFGLRQVVLQYKNRNYTERAFVTPSLYKVVRHPLYVGWITLFWATPSMTGGHLLFAAGATGYILIAIVLEERDLASVFGRRYREYARRTPMLIPFVRRNRRSTVDGPLRARGVAR